MATPLRILILNCIFFSATYLCTADITGNPLREGVAIVTTRSGEVTFTDSSGRKEQAEYHELTSLNGVKVTTGRNGQVIFSLSNGISLGIDLNSEVRFERYLQQPYLPEKESLEYESTRSELILELTSGSISFHTERISPLSKILFKLPNGQIRPHKSSGRVVYDRTGAHVTILSGIINFDYPDSAEQKFINGPDTVRISDLSARNGMIAGTLTPEEDPNRELTERLVAATRRSNERVFFKVPSDAAAIPQPVLIAKPEDLKQPSPRPYRYLD